ncbi:MAG: hypothetical protein J6F30_05860 [Cellulosilyticum sp.]|nr:hypothetical protein [Cellulosilyticum sp.]
MTQHYRHHRVVKREKEPTNQFCLQSCCDSMMEAATNQPLLALGIFLLFLLLLMKCLFCHK